MKLSMRRGGSDPVAASFFVKILAVNNDFRFISITTSIAARLLPSQPRRGLTNKHAVAIAVKAITCLHCVAIRRQDSLTARERRHQRQQCRARKMKIG